MSAPVAEKRKKYVSRLHSLEHIEGEMRARVSAGQWVAGAMLPGRRALADEFGVDVHTVQRAITPLINDGTLRVDSRRGTLVSDRSKSASSRAVNRATAASSVPAQSEPLTGQSIAVVSTIAPWLAKLQSYWPVVILHAFERSLAEIGGIDVRYINTIRPDDTAPTVCELMDNIDSEQVDAIVLVCTSTELDNARGLTEVLSKQKRLLLNVTSEAPHPKSIPYLTYDNHYAGFQAARHLIGNGYREIVFFSPVTMSWTESRLAGIREAIAAPGNPPIQLRVISGDADAAAFREASVELAMEMSESLLREGIGGRAVVAANDYTALGLLRTAEIAGLLAGQDFGLIGFDDSPEAREHGLSSLHPPLEDMGREAAGIIERALRGRSIPTQVHLHSHLIPRKSSQRLAFR